VTPFLTPWGGEGSKQREGTMTSPELQRLTRYHSNQLNFATPMLGANCGNTKIFGIIWCYLVIKIFAKHVPAHPAAEDRGGRG
jgi:hypothetical protein